MCKNEDYYAEDRYDIQGQKQKIKDALRKDNVTIHEIRKLLEIEGEYICEIDFTPDIIDFDIPLEQAKKILLIAIQVGDNATEILRKTHELKDGISLSVKLILTEDPYLRCIDELFIWNLLLQIEGDLNYFKVNLDYYLQPRLDIAARRTRISLYGESESEKEE